MKPNYTDISIILDRSGSMNSIVKATVAGFNDFVTEQALLPGEVKLSLVQFNTRKQATFTASPIREVPPLDEEDYRPQGGTALWDAVGFTIDGTGRRLEALPEEDRPSKVIVAILTDGLENASRQFNYAQVRQRIRHQQEAYSWDFVFLGANQDAIAEAAKLSIGADSALTFPESAARSPREPVGAAVAGCRAAALPVPMRWRRPASAFPPPCGASRVPAEQTPCSASSPGILSKRERISLRVCPRITDDGLPTLLSMTNLTGLDLRGCPAITDRGLKHLIAKTNWQTIWFGGCPKVTVKAVENLQRALPSAQVKKDDKEWSHHK